MNAPIRRVLPTPVASAKHSDGKSRSKSVSCGKRVCNAFDHRGQFGGRPCAVIAQRRNGAQCAVASALQAFDLRLAQAQSTGDRADQRVAHRMPVRRSSFGRDPHQLAVA